MNCLRREARPWFLGSSWHARAAAAAALARSLDQAHAVWRWGWRCRWRWRSVTPRVTHITCAARHARTPMSSPRVARVITVLCSPPAHDRHACVAEALAWSLDRLTARTQCGVDDGGGGGGQLHRVPRTSRALRVTRARACHHRASRASSPFLFPPAHDRHTCVATALARSLDRSIA